MCYYVPHYATAVDFLTCHSTMLTVNTVDKNYQNKICSHYCYHITVLRSYHNDISICHITTCPCGRVVNALGRHVQYSVTCSVAGVRLGPGTSVYQRIISNDSYAHDEQGVNPGQEIRGFNGVLYKL